MATQVNKEHFTQPKVSYKFTKCTTVYIYSLHETNIT